MTELSRRKLLAASAWAVPVVAVTVATPLVAASTDGEYGLLIVTDFPQYPPMPGVTVDGPGDRQIIVTLPASAQSVAPGSITLTIEHLDGLGVILNSSLPGTWSAGISTPELNVSYAGTNSSPTNTFTFHITNYSRWRVTLAWPGGSIEQELLIITV